MIEDFRGKPYVAQENIGLLQFRRIISYNYHDLLSLLWRAYLSSVEISELSFIPGFYLEPFRDVIFHFINFIRIWFRDLYS